MPITTLPETPGVPTIPQLHVGYLGPHLVSVNVDSPGHTFTCGAKPHPLLPPVNATANATFGHPAIKFDQPVSKVHVVMLKDQAVVYDAYFSNIRNSEIPADLKPSSGFKARWPSLCTPVGKREVFDLNMQVSPLLNPSGTFMTKAQIIADHQEGPLVAKAGGLVPPPSSHEDTSNIVSVKLGVNELFPGFL